MIRNAVLSDAVEICSIYNYYVNNTTITFEEIPVSVKEMEKRILGITSKSLPWIVYESDKKIVGYAYASKWKERSAYRYTVESTVYLNKDELGKGIGSILYRNLLEELRNRNFHSVIAVIALPNEKSQKLHEKTGFTKAAYFSEVGFKFNKWLDVGYWELKLN